MTLNGFQVTYRAAIAARTGAKEPFRYLPPHKNFSLLETAQIPLRIDASLNSTGNLYFQCLKKIEKAQYPYPQRVIYPPPLIPILMAAAFKTSM